MLTQLGNSGVACSYITAFGCKIYCRIVAIKGQNEYYLMLTLGKKKDYTHNAALIASIREAVDICAIIDEDVNGIVIRLAFSCSFVKTRPRRAHDSSLSEMLNWNRNLEGYRTNIRGVRRSTPSQAYIPSHQEYNTRNPSKESSHQPLKNYKAKCLCQTTPKKTTTT